MYRLILIITLLVLANSTFAVSDRWVWVDGNSDLAMFIDMETLNLYENGAKGWILTNYSSPRSGFGGTVLSTKIFNMYDCSSREEQHLYFSAYDKRDGEGKLIFSTKVNEALSPIVPGTIGESILKAVCK